MSEQWGNGWAIFHLLFIATQPLDENHIFTKSNQTESGESKSSQEELLQIKTSGA